MDKIKSKELLEEPTPSRFVVGIDLGTTNSAVAYVDTAKKKPSVQLFKVPQLVAVGEVESRRTLPSFHYQSTEAQRKDKASKLPWAGGTEPYIVGTYARDQGTLAPARLIASAKSWLSHSGVDRLADLLPWQGAADVDRLSPVAVSAAYLEHIRRAWDHHHAQDPLADQDIALTLPASFDEVARELTVASAKRAGLERVFLIEEPQAAFYAWINANSDGWDNLVSSGQKILICDIGGGTSDFTLLHVRRTDDGTIAFHRVAVGEHLILGGDNLDLALAHYLEDRIARGGRLEPRQWSVLVRVSRQVKESMLGEDPKDQMTVNLPGAGSKLIGGGLRAEITRDEVEQVLVEGFLPRCPLDARLDTRQSGFQEFGLPFAPDPAITKYLANFLTTHRDAGCSDDEPAGSHDRARPDVVLLNGGFFESPSLRARLLDVLSGWFQQDDPKWEPVVLRGDDLDLAVAKGAAYYGMVRRGQGVRISARLARSYYIGIESDPPSVVCLVPASVEPGEEEVITAHQFEVRVSMPVEFPLYVSSTRLSDSLGQMVPVDLEQMRQLPPIRTVLRKRRRADADVVPVQLHARLTEIGTVDIWCSDPATEQTWRLQFDVRSATATDIEVHETDGESQGIIDESSWRDCQRALEATFGTDGKAKPRELFGSLEKSVDLQRSQWPMSLLRRIWDKLLDLEAGRGRSASHEGRWLNLAGYSLRPGYGFALDDWRVAETWKSLQGKVIHHAASCRNESWILWRRLAGGLGVGQQKAIAEPLLSSVRALHRRTSTGKARGGEVIYQPSESIELWRLLGSLELLPVPTKIALGNMLIDLIPRPKLQPCQAAMVWTLGRLGARVPVYGPLNTVVPTETVSTWLEQAFQFPIDDAARALAVMQMARKTDDRYRDVPEALRNEAVSWLESADAPRHYLELVRDGGRLDTEDQGQVFGESLPVGLRIV